MEQSSESISSVSFIIEQDIPPDKTKYFLQWQKEINQVCCQFKGYLKTENFPSSSSKKNKWYTIIYFDSKDNLTLWLDSEERYHFVQARKNKLGFYRFIGYKTGLEEWLVSKKILPKWKQALAVLLGIYPIVMLETILFSSWQIIASWSLSWQILVNNLISCSVLTWLVMPLVSKLFKFWLDPPKPSLWNNYLGIFLIIIGLLLMVSFFTALL